MDVEIQINRGRSLLAKEGETLAFWIMAFITTRILLLKFVVFLTSNLKQLVII